MHIKKGRKISVVDISALNLQFPEEGLIVVAEWLIIDKNKYEYEYTMAGSNKRYYDGLTYQPTLGAVTDATGKNIWRYIKGEWLNGPFTPLTPSETVHKTLLACELVLTN